MHSLVDTEQGLSFLLLLLYLTDTRVERQRLTDAAAGFTKRIQQLQQQLDQERNSKAVALLEQQEQSQQQKHQLQALLAEAEDQLERQRRELSAGFLLQAQQIEAKHAAAAADARAEAATAAALAEARAAEAAAAHAQALERLKQVEVGCARYESTAHAFAGAGCLLLVRRSLHVVGHCADSVCQPLVTLHGRKHSQYKLTMHAFCRRHSSRQRMLKQP